MSSARDSDISQRILKVLPVAIAVFFRVASDVQVEDAREIARVLLATCKSDRK